MNILIAGGSGFIGTYLTKFLTRQGYNVTVLTRSPGKVSEKINTLQWDGKALKTEQRFDIIINLCGKNIANKRWSQKIKLELLASRLTPTKAIVSYIESYPSTKKPRLLNASAIGYYPSNDQIQTEEHPATSKERFFSKELVTQWESCAQKATEYGALVTCLRFGVVLGKGGGMLEKILPAFKLGLGTVMGNKNASLSWIHIKDLCRAILFIMLLKNPEPIYNLTSPSPCSQLTFAKTLANVCNRPCFLQFPAFFVEKFFGQMGKELLLADQKIAPRNLEDVEFKFNYINIDSALKNLISSE